MRAFSVLLYLQSDIYVLLVRLFYVISVYLVFCCASNLTGGLRLLSMSFTSGRLVACRAAESLWF